MSSEAEPTDQTIFEGQNAIFECRLNGNNGRLVPVQWSIQMEDSPPNFISMNTSQYYILPPANSVLVFTNATLSLNNVFVQCTAPVETLFFAMLTVQSECMQCIH